MTDRYTISEWFGLPFAHLPVGRRQELAKSALGETEILPCPFQRDHPPCGKRGGVCSIQAKSELPVITCPNRFEEGDLLPTWLARIVGFPEVYLASELPFMHSPSTGKAAGRVDLVIAKDREASAWFGLEIQAVYFSGERMSTEFEKLKRSIDTVPPEPIKRRRPDWRSSSAKRLMPQLQVKVPTLRRWGNKLAVAVDLPFFKAIGGPSPKPSQDLNDGDIIWLVPQINDNYKLEPHHWEVLSLEASCDKLLSAETIKRQEFEAVLRTKLQRIS